jgi:hypothetical protein
LRHVFSARDRQIDVQGPILGRDEPTVMFDLNLLVDSKDTRAESEPVLSEGIRLNIDLYRPEIAIRYAIAQIPLKIRRMVKSLEVTVEFAEDEALPWHDRTHDHRIPKFSTRCPGAFPSFTSIIVDAMSSETYKGPT